MDRPIRSEDDLLAIFFEACSSEQLLGVESEKFGIVRGTLAPLRYDGPGASVETLFERLSKAHGWRSFAFRPRSASPTP